MSRRLRITVPNFAHHITQRGCRRQHVFFRDTDREVYLGLLGQSSEKFGAEIISYCLMTNHIHLLLVPKREDSIRWIMQITHKRYAEYINSLHQWSGHLWQQRFYSCVVDEYYFWPTIHYIERNPVKAGMVSHPADYPWSSAAAHCGLREDTLITKDNVWSKQLRDKTDWNSWLKTEVLQEDVEALRRCTRRDLPCGKEAFFNCLKEKHGISVAIPKLGRPRKMESRD